MLQPMATATLGKGQFSISAPGASQLQRGPQARPLVSCAGGGGGEVLPEISSAKEGGSQLWASRGGGRSAWPVFTYTSQL